MKYYLLRISELESMHVVGYTAEGDDWAQLIAEKKMMNAFVGPAWHVDWYSSEEVTEEQWNNHTDHTDGTPHPAGHCWGTRKHNIKEMGA